MKTQSAWLLNELRAEDVDATVTKQSQSPTKPNQTNPNPSKLSYNAWFAH